MMWPRPFLNTIEKNRNRGQACDPRQSKTRLRKPIGVRPDPDLHFISKPNDRVLRVYPRPPTSFAPAMKKRYKTRYYSISRECP
jgi:hypothetical protein